MGQDFEKLKEAIYRLHGCRSEHLETAAVSARFGDALGWQGSVEVFCLLNHPHARLCYAWSYRDGLAESFVAVLGLPAIRSPLDAVRAFVLTEAKKQKAN